MLAVVEADRPTRGNGIKLEVELEWPLLRLSIPMDMAKCKNINKYPMLQKLLLHPNDIISMTLLARM